MLSMHYEVNKQLPGTDQAVKTRDECEAVMDGDFFDPSIEKARSLTLTPDNVQDASIPTEFPFTENKPVEDLQTNYEEPYDPEDHLCVGERIDDIYDIQPSSGDYYSESKEEDNPVNGNNNSICSEKRRQFSSSHSPGSSAFHSVDSLSSELSSHSRHSVSSFLQAREYDAEDVLLSLGLGGDCRMSVPERFLVNSSSAKGIDLDVVRRNIDDDEDDVFDANSLSYSSSWSERNPVLERLPQRFITSTSSLGSAIDFSESEESETQTSSLPIIVEPEQHDENSFDLMRHLRLNRIQNPGREQLRDRILLEPVTEELEVSSVGSGSARTKISNTQQDSLDSLGNTSVLTKISRRHSEDSFKERIPLDNSSFQEEPREDNQQTIEQVDEDEGDDGNNEQECDDDNRIVNTETSSGKDVQQGDNESGISSAGDSVNLNTPSALRPPVLRVLTSEKTHHDSFELEEIATSEENLDKIDDKRMTNKDSNVKTRPLKRENSDESSGFEDDVKKRSIESLDVDDMKTNPSEGKNNSHVCSNDLQKHLLLPCDVSTPKTDAETRRSAFAKRNSWSTSKQKRVVFQDEATELTTKSRSFDERNLSAYKLETRRCSLDVPLTCTGARETDLVTEPKADNEGTKETNQLQSTLEKNAVHNIKKFLSNLMSIRSRFRKTVQEEEQKVRDVPSTSVPSTGISSITFVQSPSAPQMTQATDSGFVRHDMGQLRDKRLKTSTDIECFVSGNGAYQGHCIEELDSFEDDLKKYCATFMTMEVTSTSQESYYTRKLLARFAWDIMAIRKLRSLIKKELATMQSSLTDRRLYLSQISDTPLPHGVVDQMKCLLSMQCSLQTYLLNLAESVPHFHWKTTSSPLLNSSASNTSERSTEDVTNEIKHSVFQDLSHMFQEQVESLRKELKEKDDMINELIVKVERIEKANAIQKHGV